MVHSGVLLGSGVSPTKSVGSDNGEVWKPQLDLSGGSLQRHSHSFSSHGSRKDLNGQKELCPRLCHLKKGPNGYGFNLHSEKSRPGQFIRSVDPDSPASRAGLRPQDRLVEVNGINVEGLRHSEVVSHIKARESEARLLVVDPETDDYFKKLGVTPTEEHTKGVVPQPLTNGSAQTQLNGGSTSSSHSDLQSPGKESEVKTPITHPLLCTCLRVYVFVLWYWVGKNASKCNFSFRLQTWVHLYPHSEQNREFAFMPCPVNPHEMQPGARGSCWLQPRGSCVSGASMTPWVAWRGRPEHVWLERAGARRAAARAVRAQGGGQQWQAAPQTHVGEM
uniref:SLC9A3 regulator 2 n=1 Tax=Anser cygnoides TaxID=8845 RepID=A0A8B9E7F8_ANSCY